MTPAFVAGRCAYTASGTGCSSGFRWKIEVRVRVASLLALDGQRAAVLLGNPVADRQSKPCPDVAGFRREGRIEDALSRLDTDGIQLA